MTRSVAARALPVLYLALLSATLVVAVAGVRGWRLVPLLGVAAALASATRLAGARRQRVALGASAGAAVVAGALTSGVPGGVLVALALATLAVDVAAPSAQPLVLPAARVGTTNRTT